MFGCFNVYVYRKVVLLTAVISMFQDAVGPALTAGLASVAAVQVCIVDMMKISRHMITIQLTRRVRDFCGQPEDPVDYLAHWLLKYLAVEEKKAKVIHYVGSPNTQHHDDLIKIIFPI